MEASGGARTTRRSARPAASPQPGIAELREVARNLRWTWSAPALTLFERLDPDRWRGVNGNPLRLLDVLGASGVRSRLAADQELAALAAAVVENFTTYEAERDDTWFRERQVGSHEPFEVAYLSAEFAFCDALPIYAGGLGAVAGEQLKSASALGVPLVGVGLLYRETSHQWLDDDGRQQESWEVIEPERMPLAPARDVLGRPLEVTVPFPGRDIVLRVWTAPVGRNRLVLLDSAAPANSADDRRITRRLYGGDLETRIQQELLLGVGGLRALAALGHEPTFVHLNEGHTAFATLERIRRQMARAGLTFAEAREAVAHELLFTTHTPVAAGHDYFPPALARRYLAPYAALLGIALDELLALGRVEPARTEDAFCPTVLALRLAGNRAGVSRLHGSVTREQWARSGRGCRSPRCRSDTSRTGSTTSRGSPEMGDLLDRRSRHAGAGTRSTRHVAAAARGGRRRALGRPPGRAGAARRLLRGLARRPARPPRRRAGPDRGGPLAARPGGADARLRRALRRVQAPDAVPRGPRPARADPRRRRPPGADRLRRQGAPARRGRQGAAADGGDVRAERRAREPARLPRGLRHDDGPAARPGRRRLAEHPASAARGLRHRRHEVRRERRAQLLDRGRLVGRGLGGRRRRRAADRLVHRRRRGLRRPRRAGCRRRRVVLRAAGAGDRADVLRARRARRPDALARERQAVDRDARPDVALAPMVQDYAERYYLPGAQRGAPPVGGGARARDVARAVRRLRAAWDEVSLRVGEPTVDERGRLLVRIDATLGGLSPADVRVQLWVAAAEVRRWR
ncbi:MAG: alpha-glucan family phosphorylase [Thermoleophilia bacterium]